jgi:tetratricopeptide (TPR) repeat protein
MSRSTIVRLLVVTLLPLFAIQAQAQRDNDPMLPGSLFEVSGQVRSADNKTVENVTVRLETASGALVDQGGTDSTGRFRFSRLPSGQYRLSARAQGLLAPAQLVDVTRSSPRMYVMLTLLPEPLTFRSSEARRAGIIDVRVSNKASGLLEKGRAALADKKPNDAIAHLQQAINIQPDYFEAHFLLASIYMDQNDWNKARDLLVNALKINPQSSSVMVSLGEVYRRQKKYADSKKLLEAAVALDSNSWEAHFTLGRVYWELKDIPKSGLHIARTIELQPNLAEARLLAGNIFIRAGLPQNAVVEYEEYLRLSPEAEFSVEVRQLVDRLKKSLASK